MKAASSVTRGWECSHFGGHNEQRKRAGRCVFQMIQDVSQCLHAARQLLSLREEE
jgi:hypothetical protein